MQSAVGPAYKQQDGRASVIGHEFMTPNVILDTGSTSSVSSLLRVGPDAMYAPGEPGYGNGKLNAATPAHQLGFAF